MDDIYLEEVKRLSQGTLLHVRWIQPGGIIVNGNLRSRAPGDEDLFPKGDAQAYAKVGLVKLLDKKVRTLGKSKA